MEIYDLAIEVTRKCNMSCEHCLRGSKQNIDIDLNYIDSLFNKVNYISNLSITGGEPSLSIKAINHIIKTIKKKKIVLGSFYIATNGKNIKPEFVLSAMELYLLCEEKESCSIQKSIDYYHEENEDESLLQALSFYSERNNRKGSLINQGKAKKHGLGQRENNKEEFEVDENRIIEGRIYLNALGKVIAGCDWSYKEQKQHTICDIKEFCIDKVLEYVNAN